MYASADRISDKVTDSPQSRKTACFAANRAKNSEKRPRTAKNRPFCEDEAPLLHYGNNGAKTFRLRQDLRCGMPIFRAGSRPKSAFAGLANPEHQAPKKRKPVWQIRSSANSVLNRWVNRRRARVSAPPKASLAPRGIRRVFRARLRRHLPGRWRRICRWTASCAGGRSLRSP
jgi:hypothetical protein